MLVSVIVISFFSYFKGKILIGSKDNDVMEISEKSGAVTVVVGGHAEGEVWGLDRHPSLPRFITASYDGTVRLWDVSSKVCIYVYLSVYLHQPLPFPTSLCLLISFKLT